MFSRPVFKALSQGRIPVTLERYVNDVHGSSLELGDAFEHAYAHLWSSYRSEYLYKNEVVSRIVFGRHSPSTATFVTEFRTGDSLADAVVFNGTSSVYEIKTEHDSLGRLHGQLADYLQVFDKVNVVTHERHVNAVLAMAPAHVGVLCLTDKGSLSEIRSAASNRENVRPARVFATLRRAEYLNILKRTLNWEPDMPPGLRMSAALAQFSTLAPITAHDEAVAELRKRTTGEATVGFVRTLPASLRTLGLSEPLSGIGKQRVAEILTRHI